MGVCAQWSCCSAFGLMKTAHMTSHMRHLGLHGCIGLHYFQPSPCIALCAHGLTLYCCVRDLACCFLLPQSLRRMKAKRKTSAAKAVVSELAEEAAGPQLQLTSSPSPLQPNSDSIAAKLVLLAAERGSNDASTSSRGAITPALASDPNRTVRVYADGEQDEGTPDIHSSLHSQTWLLILCAPSAFYQAARGKWVQPHCQLPPRHHVTFP